MSKKSKSQSSNFSKPLEADKELVPLIDLPHPQRLAAGPLEFDVYRAFESYAGPAELKELAEVRKMSKSYTRDFTTYAHELASNYPAIKALYGQIDMMDFSPEPGKIGNGTSSLSKQYFAFRCGYGRQFKFEQSLIKSLLCTDISEELPLTLMRPSHPLVYIELGAKNLQAENYAELLDEKELEAFPKVHNPASGWHSLEGAYVAYFDKGDVFDAPWISIIITGSPKNNDAQDDAYESFSLMLENEKGEPLTILQAIEKNFQLAKDNSFTYASLDNYSVSTSSRQAVLLICKALLFLNTDSFRKTVVNEKTEALEKSKIVINAAKKRKMVARAQRLSDHILISSKESEFQQGLIGKSFASTGRKIHYRRGFLRNQPHGPERTLRKLIFIEPTLVGTKLDQELPVREYVVKS